MSPSRPSPVTLALLALSLLGCPPKAGGPGGAKGGPTAALGWLRAAPADPGFCVSAVLEAGPYPAGQALFSTASPDTLVAGIPGLTDEHPAAAAAKAGLMWISGQAPEAREALRALVNAHPTDACLQAAIARTYADLGALRIARGHAEEAVRIAPEDSGYAYLLGALQQAEGDGDRAAATWRGLLQRDPAHPGANVQLAGIYLQQGDHLMAIPLLERAMAAGMPVEGALAQAYFGTGQLGPYVALASRKGAPLGDGGRIGASDQPEQVLREVLGVGADGALWAEIRTTVGPLRCALFWQEAPITVANFAGLARGTQPWVDPRTDTPGVGALYDQTLFHRVIPEFMVQGGDPRGDGTGGPGYRFADELTSGRTFDRPGLLAMANSGPGTNGSQWFITEVPVPHLNGRHTIFGECDAESLERVRVIARQPRGPDDVPLETMRVEHIEIYGGIYGGI